jgi:hypothetical protein
VKEFMTLLKKQRVKIQIMNILRQMQNQEGLKFTERGKM